MNESEEVIQEVYSSLLARASPDFQKALQEEADYQARVLQVQALLPGGNTYTYEQVAAACAASGIRTSGVAFCLASEYNCEGLQLFYGALGKSKVGTMNDLTSEQEARFRKLDTSIEERFLAYVAALQPFLTIMQQAATAMNSAWPTIVVDTPVQNVETEEE